MQACSQVICEPINKFEAEEDLELEPSAWSMGTPNMVGIYALSEFSYLTCDLAVLILPVVACRSHESQYVSHFLCPVAAMFFYLFMTYYNLTFPLWYFEVFSS